MWETVHTAVASLSTRSINRYMVNDQCFLVATDLPSAVFLLVSSLPTPSNEDLPVVRPCLLALTGLVFLAFVASYDSRLATADAPTHGTFAAFVDDYYAALFAWDPNQATYAGIHDSDGKLPDLTAERFADRAATLKKQHTELRALRAGKLTDDEVIDAEVLDHAIRAELLDIEIVRDWKRNPVLYLGRPAEGIDLLIKRSFAPPAERLKAVIGRLKAAPPLLAAMKANVVNPPKEFTDLGIIVAKGSVSFFRTDLPAWAKTAAGKDEKLFTEFEGANKPVVEMFEAAAKWLTNDLLPQSTGQYAIGADAFLKKLETEEMVDIPLDKLLATGEANLKRDQDALVETAKKIDPKRTPAEVLAVLNEDYPKSKHGRHISPQATSASITSGKPFLSFSRLLMFRSSSSLFLSIASLWVLTWVEFAALGFAVKKLFTF
jgi:hypothetical protein